MCVPKFTANLYCVCLIIPQIYTEADEVQICGKFRDTQYSTLGFSGKASCMRVVSFFMRGMVICVTWAAVIADMSWIKKKMLPKAVSL